MSLTPNTIVQGPPIRKRFAHLHAWSWRIVLLFAGLTGAGAATKLALAASSAGPSVPVLTLTASSVANGVSLEGEAQAVKQSTLSSQASGRLAQWMVKAGDRVKAGQVLAVIDDRATQTGISRAQADVAQAKAQLAQAHSQLQRTRELQAQGFVAQASLDSALAQYQAAQAGAQQAAAGRTLSDLAQGFTRVTAPYDGWVMATHAEAGDLALPGKPLVTVYAPQPMRAVVHVPVSQLAQARQASQIQVGLADGRWIAPTRRATLPLTDPVSQTVEWRLELSTIDAEDLLPGQPLKVRFGGSTSTKLMLPETAVLRRGELTAVYVEQGPAFALRAVRVGPSLGNQGVQVLAGLKAGERVALDAVRAGLAGARPADAR